MLFVVLLVPAPLAAGSDGSSASQREDLFFAGPGAVAELSAVLVGQGVEGVSVPPALANVGTIEWRAVREVVDEIGMRHLYYRQSLKPPDDLAAMLNELDPASRWVELEGTELSLHFDQSGMLRSAHGAQYPSVFVPRLPVVRKASHAVEIVSRELLNWPQFAGGWGPQGPPGTDEGTLSRMRMVLIKTGSADFSFAWRVPVMDSSGHPFEAVLDAGSATILFLRSKLRTAECAPTAGTAQTATGFSQNGCYSRSTKAVAVPDQLPAFTHEAVRPAGSGIPSIQIYFACPTLWSPQCTQYAGFLCQAKSWGMLPVKSTGGNPVYDNWLEGGAYLPGRSAVDALWNTYQTMYTFWNDFGWYSWDGAGASAPVLINYNWYETGENAYWYEGPSYSMPGTGIAFTERNGCKPANGYPDPWSCPPQFSASLDVVAHEWGHGVISTTAKFPDDGGVGSELAEGFADFVGYAVEFARQPVGTGCEKAEWKIGEDTPIGATQPDYGSAVFRQATPDDGPMQTTKPYRGRLSFHKDDPPVALGGHDRGNMLGVAFRLLKDGGRNPVCERPGANFSGCNVTVTGQGTKAAKILWRTLTLYCGPSNTWQSIPALAKLAAFDLYSVCPRGNGAAQQQAVNDAFTSIGYPSSGTYPCP